MLKRVFAFFLIIISFSLIRVNVYAAPKTMNDGTIFDAEFYASQYPDVVDALGTDESVLYEHYKQFGKNEGRLPYNNASTQTITDKDAAIKAITDPIASYMVAGDIKNAKSIIKTTFYDNFSENTKSILAPYMVASFDEDDLYYYALPISYSEGIMGLCFNYHFGNYSVPGDLAIGIANTNKEPPKNYKDKYVVIKGVNYFSSGDVVISFSHASATGHYLNGKMYNASFNSGIECSDFLLLPIEK